MVQTSIRDRGIIFFAPKYPTMSKVFRHKFGTGVPGGVPRLDDKLRKNVTTPREETHEFGFHLCAEDNELLETYSVQNSSHSMRILANGHHVTLEWYVPFATLMEGEDATSLHIDWPERAPLYLQPSLQESHKRILLHPYIGVWESRHGEQRQVGLCWDADKKRFDVCDTLKMSSEFDRDGKWMLMPAIIQWTKSSA